MKIFHQAGHNTNWNIESLTRDHAGDGIIFSPVHYGESNIIKQDEVIKNSSLFDPQFYVPDSQKAKLQTYAFFPEAIMDGFKTTDYQALAHESAKLCLEFQINQGFESIIIPSRFYEDLVTDFIERQKVFTVEPFLNELSLIGTDKDVYTSLSMTAPMLMDERYRTNILNWVTSYQQIDGIYLQIDFGERLKQIQDYAKLISYIQFVVELIEADLKVICGYMNVEGLLASVLKIDAVTMGAYENTRIFSTDKFLVNDKIQMGPAPRIFLPKLLNWVRYDTAIEIMEDFPSLWDKIYTPTHYADEVIANPRKPHFAQPALYKHHFILMDKLYNDVIRVPNSEKVDLVSRKVDEANSLYEELESNKVLFFDKNCKGDHLIIWNRVLRNLRKNF